ncbi:MAG: YebC/PmpR family DNA-binding transcriptional regulator [Caldilineaceae bacterium]|nr:YebC/PmpR family DNA-binding transcriptional regulator [Caldilineaceae bacterium]
MNQARSLIFFKGYIVFNLVDDDGVSKELDSEELFMASLEAGAEDVVVLERGGIYIRNTEQASVNPGLYRMSYTPDSWELIMKPTLTMGVAGDEADTVLGLVDNLR